MAGIYDKLKSYSKTDFYPFHMPGHKRNPASGPLSEFYQYDITEIDGFDDLHAASGILEEAQRRAAQLYDSTDTFYLVNGSTGGILSGISAMAERGKKLIMARNCHKSVYHGLILNHLEPEYLYPDLIDDFGIAGGITPEKVQHKIKEIMERDYLTKEEVANVIAGLVITSPSYDGIVSDVAGITKIAHEYGIPIMVDQAHGAHFGFCSGYPESAVRQGADLVIHSTHKTLPAPTQTALLHRNGNFISKGQIQKYLRIYQTSSPSYLLMAGMDSCISYVGKYGKERLEELLRYRSKLMDSCKKLRYIKLYQAPDQEPSKLLISVHNTCISGYELSGILRKQYHLEMEMCTDTYVVALLSMMDREEGFVRLSRALCAIDESLSEGKQKSVYERHSPEIVEKPAEAFRQETELIEEELAIGKGVGAFINLYPPGIPILVPGEKVDDKVVDRIRYLIENKLNVQGVTIAENGHFLIPCLREYIG